MVSALSDKRGVKDGSESILQHGEPSLCLYLLRIWSRMRIKNIPGHWCCEHKEITSEHSWYFIWLSQLLWVHYTTQTITEKRANCSEDVLLTCPDINPDNMDFFSLIWYKVRERLFHTEMCSCSICASQPLISLDFWLLEQFQNQTKHAIIRRGKADGRTLTYKFNRPAEFGKNLGLLLRNVTPLDSGGYECAISANVMGQNLNLQVNLVVNGESRPSFNDKNVLNLKFKRRIIQNNYSYYLIKCSVKNRASSFRKQTHTRWEKLWRVYY